MIKLGIIGIVGIVTRKLLCTLGEPKNGDLIDIVTIVTIVGTMAESLR